MEIKETLNVKASAETIYKAMSTDKGIKAWWCKTSLIGEKEGEYTLLKFDKNQDGNITDMAFVTETLEPNKKVVWNCVGNKNPAWVGTKIVVEVNGNGNNSEVVFTHTNFDEKWEGQDPFEMTKGGWLGHFVPSLVSFCETGEGNAW